MRRYSPPYYSPPRRGYDGGGRGRGRGRMHSRSPPPRRGYGGSGGGGYGRHREQNNGSLLVRNIPLDCRPEELRMPFERFGAVRDVYIPKDYYSGEPKGFAFVQFLDSLDAMEAQHRMNGQIIAGREISVVAALETRKRPEEMRHRTRPRGGFGGRSSYYGRSRSRSLSRSPRQHPESRPRYRSRPRSPARWSRDYSASPARGHAERRRSSRGSPGVDAKHNDKVYSPRHADADHAGVETDNGRKRGYDDDEARNWRPSPRRHSRSPSGSRSRSADA